MDAAEIYRKQNLGNRIGFGEKAALLIVDFVNGFNNPEMLGGGNIAAAIDHTRRLLSIVRSHKLPVAFTRIVYEPGQAGTTAFARKIPSLASLTEQDHASQIVPELAPEAGELIIRKTQASAFFGTDLAPWLVGHRVDTILVAGCTTSGCVRASVVDAISWNFRPMVVRECVGDRALEPHEASLFDMDQKYADVMSANEALSALAASTGR